MSKSEQNRIGKIAFFAVLTAAICVLETGCCKFRSAAEKRTDSTAREWLHPWQGRYDWTEYAAWEDIPQSGIAKAELLLRDRPAEALTDAQLLGLTGHSAAGNPPSTSPYLVRGVGASNGKLPLHVFFRASGDVWIGGEAISRCEVVRQRRAVVVWLERSPKQVYVTFVVAK